MHTARMGLGGKRDLLVSGTDYSSNYSRSRSRERMEGTDHDGAWYNRGGTHVTSLDRVVWGV